MLNVSLFLVNKPAVRPEKKIPFLKISIVEQIKAESKSASVEIKRLEIERVPHPELSVLAEKYSCLKEIDHKFKNQNNAIFGREKKHDNLKKELYECNAFGKCVGIFRSGRRKKLQQEIDSIDVQISNMKKRLSSIAREYKLCSVQAFYKEFNAAKREYFDYQTDRAEWEKTCGNKAENSMSIRDRLKVLFYLTCGYCC